MDTCTPVSTISEDFASCVESAYICCKLTYLGTKQCSACISAQESAEVVPVEDLNNCQGCLSNEENLKVEELGSSFSDLLIEDLLDQWPCHKLGLEVEMCPSASLQAQRSLKSDNFVYARSNSLPATPKLVSALKGGREKEGAPPKTKLRVKWAPDVYDPPATSMSHSVKNNHYQRPKAKKKDQHKYKHKNKSTRGSTREKQQHASHSNLGGNANPQNSRLLVPESSSIVDVSARSSVRVLNYMASNQESKCGSSVLSGSFAKLNFSVAEAT